MGILGLLALLFPWSGGCGAPLRQVSTVALEFYRDPGLPDLNGIPIALLQTAVVSRSGQLIEFRSAVSDLLEEAFRVHRPDRKIIPTREVLSRINQTHLTRKYAEMLRTYEITGILDRDVLRALGRMMGIRYLLQPRLMHYTERTSVRLSAFGLALISTRETTVKVALQLWDAWTGAILWEGTGQGTVATEVMRATPISFEEVARVACESVVKRFP